MMDSRPRAFLEIARQDRLREPISQRVRHFHEFVIPLGEDKVRSQAARCIACGVPYCHTGCPVNNIIPDWNDLVSAGDWRQALHVLHSTNNFPEFTGRLCPAPCEAACTLNLQDNPVTIKTIECAIIDRGWEEGWVYPEIPAHRTGKRVAVVGSGPAGLAAAQQLCRAGHNVVVYEREDRIGGLLRYGIPDFKIEKQHIDRRIAQMQAEGVEFLTKVHVGQSLVAHDFIEGHDAIVLACGTEQPRDLNIPGRHLGGIHFAMEYLVQQNKQLSGMPRQVERPLSARGKNVIVIGGGDTGADCIGTANRQGARSIVQFDHNRRPPDREDKRLTWPHWPLKLYTSSSHEEGCHRQWAVEPKCFLGENGQVTALHCVRVNLTKLSDGRRVVHELPGTEFSIPADLVLLSMGYAHPVHQGLVSALQLELDRRGNVQASIPHYRANVLKVFVCGDMRRGQSLVVWAIREGRECARAVDEALMGASELPS
jgi:glutamate synthase (NADPH/NADH) small chain